MSGFTLYPDNQGRYTGPIVKFENINANRGPTDPERPGGCRDLIPAITEVPG